MNLFEEMKNKSDNYIKAELDVVNEIIDYFKERINSEKFIDYLKEELNDNDCIRKRELLIMISFIDDYGEESFSLDNFIVWFCKGYYYKDIKIMTIKTRIINEIRNCLCERVKKLGFKCYWLEKNDGEKFYIKW